MDLISKPLLQAIKSSHIFPDPDSPPISGYILIHDSQIQEILPFDSPEIPLLKCRNYIILDHENDYIFPGLIDLNVHLNSTYDSEWQDVENTSKMALQGGITTIIDNPIMNTYFPSFDESQAIDERFNALKDRIYTDTGLLAYIGPHNLDKIEDLWSKSPIIGFRMYLARSLMHQLPHFETKHLSSLKKQITGLSPGNYRFFIHCESATGRDLFTCSPLRYENKETRLDMKWDIKDAGKFGGGIQGEIGSLEDSNKSSSDSEKSRYSEKNSRIDKEEEKDRVDELHKLKNPTFVDDEISSGLLRKKADKNAKLQDEQSIARLEIIGYSFNEEEKEKIKKYESSVSELEFVSQSSDSLEQFKDLDNTSERADFKKNISVMNIKKKVILSSKINPKLENKAFVQNPLIGKLRGALNSLKKEEDEAEMNIVSLSESLINTTTTNRTLSPSSLLQRRKITGSPSFISYNTNNTDGFSINIRKAQEDTSIYEKELKINRNYELFLSNHSLSWESNGVYAILSQFSDVFLQGRDKGSLILSNLSSSNSAFQVRNKNKACQYNLKIYCETSTPFIYFHQKQIKPGQGKYKCSPCIRDKETRKLLIDGLGLKYLFSAVSSFHLQTDQKYKNIEKGNFKRCFNGVSTIGSNLQVVWSKLYCREKQKSRNPKKYEEILKKLVFLLASSPAELAGLEKKGKIKAGYDADLVIWDPFSIIEMNEENICLKYPKIYLFQNQKFYGKVKKTYLRGKLVFSKDGFIRSGNIITHK